MHFLEIPRILLAWIGNQGTRAVAAIAVLGIALPGVGEWFSPYLTEAVFLLLCIAFLRFETSGIGKYFRQLVLLFTAILWISIVVPGAVGVSCINLNIHNPSPDLFPGLLR